jgi:hypothetical protein
MSQGDLPQAGPGETGGRLVALEAMQARSAFWPEQRPQLGHDVFARGRCVSRTVRYARLRLKHVPVVLFADHLFVTDVFHPVRYALFAISTRESKLYNRYFFINVIRLVEYAGAVAYPALWMARANASASSLTLNASA